MQLLFNYIFTHHYLSLILVSDSADQFSEQVTPPSEELNTNKSVINSGCVSVKRTEYQQISSQFWVPLHSENQIPANCFSTQGTPPSGELNINKSVLKTVYPFLWRTEYRLICSQNKVPLPLENQMTNNLFSGQSPLHLEN